MATQFLCEAQQEDAERYPERRGNGEGTVGAREETQGQQGSVEDEEVL